MKEKQKNQMGKEEVLGWEDIIIWQNSMRWRRGRDKKNTYQGKLSTEDNEDESMHRSIEKRLVVSMKL